jgi:prepilin-type N-terminal cleavage/methylation domain-containing protein
MRIMKQIHRVNGLLLRVWQGFKPVGLRQTLYASKGFTLLEMALSLSIMTLIAASLVNLISTSLNRQAELRRNLHQHITLNNLATVFRQEAEAATMVAWDNPGGRWILFENDAYIVQYRFAQQGGKGVFFRELRPKASPMPLQITNPNQRPNGWVPTLGTSALEALPEKDQDKMTFSCGNPCFSVTNTAAVVWRAPRIQTFTPPNEQTLISRVFGEMGYTLQDVVALRLVGTTIE